MSHLDQIEAFWGECLASALPNILIPYHVPAASETIRVITLRLPVVFYLHWPPLLSARLPRFCCCRPCLLDVLGYHLLRVRVSQLQKEAEALQRKTDDIASSRAFLERKLEQQNAASADRLQAAGRTTDQVCRRQPLPFEFLHLLHGSLEAHFLLYLSRFSRPGETESSVLMSFVPL